MHLDVDDDGFVRAPKGLVYRCLTDLGGWPSWWPGCTVSTVAGSPESWDLVLGGAALQRPVRLHVRAHTWRHDEGFALELQGALTGRAEFWLEEGWGGTVVHHLASAEIAARRPQALARAYRAALRRGLGGLKDGLQTQVRQRLDLAP